MSFGNPKSLVRTAALVALLLNSFSLWAGSDAKVFPVAAFFYDNTEKSTLDSNFRAKVDEIGIPVLGSKIKGSLTAAFKDKVGPLDRHTAERTFVVSFHVPRATSYSVNKGNGNSDLVASVTASLYFTNVLTGEILTTISNTVVSRAVISNNAKMDVEKGKLFAQALDTLIADLANDGARNFSPSVIDAKITDNIGNLIVLNAGYSKGIQTGDSLNDSSGQLIEVVYAADGYSLAQRVLADNVGTGVVFHKYLSHASDGKLKPRTVVLVEAKPDGFPKEYIAQLFSELVGDKAPLSIIQVNPGFANMLQTVVQDVNVKLSTSDTANRKTPDLFIRLRVPEPIIYEAHTNLDFQTTRHYKSLAFADIVDSNGRVNFSAVGKNVIDDSITHNVGPGIPERREVSIKNALIDLAQKLGKLSEPRREQVAVVPDASGDAYIANAGKFFAPQQKGVVLHKVKVQMDKGSQQVWLPITEASVESGADPAKMRLSLGLPLTNPVVAVGVDNVFEIQRLGITPLSAYTFSVCGPSESLGTVLTPSLLDLTENSLSNKMPGILYAPSVKEDAADLIGTGNNFERAVNWQIPPIAFCIQPVERVTTGDDKCTDHCERPITARYTLRVKAGNDVVSRSGFESQFKSTDFYKETPVDQIVRLVDADLIDQAQLLLDKDANVVSFIAK